MRIGELAQRTAVPTKTIRYYEGIGVMPEPHRSANGYRDYVEADVERLNFVRDAQASGLSLTEIASIMELRAAGESTCHHVVELLEQHLDGLDAHIAKLQQTRKTLLQLTNRARALDPATCTDPIRCQTIEAAREDSSDGVHLPSRPHQHRH